MFSSFSKSHYSYSISSQFFTNLYVELFPNSIANTSNELPHILLSAYAPTLVESTFTVNVASVPNLLLSTQVKETPYHLDDYHCFSTIVTLHEPRFYREASIDPHWQQVINDEL